MVQISRKIFDIDEKNIEKFFFWNKEETKWGIQLILENGKFTLIKLNYHFKFGLKLNILNQNVIIKIRFLLSY